jgi:ribosomal protein L32
MGVLGIATGARAVGAKQKTRRKKPHDAAQLITQDCDVNCGHAKDCPSIAYQTGNGNLEN